MKEEKMRVAARFSQPNLTPSHLMRARYSSGTISFPVKPNQAIYAHFKHVSGFPSPDGRGISLFRLHGIDNLIDRLVSIKQSSGNQEQRNRIDTMIKTLEAAKATVSDKEMGAFVRNNADTLHSLTQNIPAGRHTGEFNGLIFNISA